MASAPCSPACAAYLSLFFLSCLISPPLQLPLLPQNRKCGTRNQTSGDWNQDYRGRAEAELNNCLAEQKQSWMKEKEHLRKEVQLREENLLVGAVPFAASFINYLVTPLSSADFSLTSSISPILFPLFNVQRTNFYNLLPSSIVSVGSLPSCLCRGESIGERTAFGHQGSER